MDVRRPSSAVVLLGAGGHARVLLSLLRAGGWTVRGVCDPGLAAAGTRQWRGLPVLGGDDALAALDPGDVGLVNGVGQLVGGTVRHALFARLRKKGFHFPVLVHPAAWVDATATLADGVQVMAGAIIQADAIVGADSIVNTRAGIDHDCVIGAGVHIAPGATLCGSVRVLDHAFVAAGATVIQGLTVGTGAVVGAGATLVRDLEDHHILVGGAARKRPRPGP